MAHSEANAFSQQLISTNDLKNPAKENTPLPLVCLSSDGICAQLPLTALSAGCGARMRAEARNEADKYPNVLPQSTSQRHGQGLMLVQETELSFPLPLPPASVMQIHKFSSLKSKVIESCGDHAPKPPFAFPLPLQV